MSKVPTLGEVFEAKLAIAVKRELITESQKRDWVSHPPLSLEQANHRKFIIRLVDEAERKVDK